MKKEIRISTTLIWYHRNSGETPAIGHRIAVMSPTYDKDDPFRTRLIDSQFFERSTDAEWWAYINLPVE